jgi:hypothetical protein
VGGSGRASTRASGIVSEQARALYRSRIFRIIPICLSKSMYIFKLFSKDNMEVNCMHSGIPAITLWQTGVGSWEHFCMGRDPFGDHLGVILMSLARLGERPGSICMSRKPDQETVSKLTAELAGPKFRFLGSKMGALWRSFWDTFPNKMLYQFRKLYQYRKYQFLKYQFLN